MEMRETKEILFQHQIYRTPIQHQNRMCCWVFVVSRCRIVLSRHVTKIKSFEHAQKKKKQIVDDARKGKHVKAGGSSSLF